MTKAKAIQFLSEAEPGKFLAAACPAVELAMVAVVVSDKTLALLLADRQPNLEMFAQNALLCADHGQNIKMLCSCENTNAIGVIKTRMLLANQPDRLVVTPAPLKRYEDRPGIRWLMNTIIRDMAAHITMKTALPSAATSAGRVMLCRASTYPYPGARHAACSDPAAVPQQAQLPQPDYRQPQ